MKFKERKKNILYILNIIHKYIYVFFLSISFILMDIITRIFGRNIGFYRLVGITPNLFTLTWVFLFVGLTLTFKKKIGKLIYLSTSIIFLILFLINNIYHSMTKNFFDFSLIESTSEGIPYILDTIKNCNPLVYLFALLILLLIIYGLKIIPPKKQNNIPLIISIIIIFIILHALIPLTLGPANQKLTWSTWNNPRDVYTLFNDNNKSLKVSGLFEYSIRNFYVTFIKPKEKETKKDIKFLKQSYKTLNNETNNYTGIFKDKNVIFVQFEGLDNWLITKEDTPTIYSMLNNSINFENHFSYYNGGGSTFNSEFAVNTGFITPLSYIQNAYTFNKNYFPYSLANILKKQNYISNAFHMNSGEYYSRKLNYINWGYNNYYGLIDMFDYKDETYTLDRELILNKKFNNLLFPKDQKFMDYIITYSGHMPFTNTKGVCKLLYNEDNENNKTKMTEEECIRRQAKETDYMMELLLENLENKKLIDNTIIIAFSDHYLYTVKDKNILNKYKETDNNLINKTPFFIWSKNGPKISIKEVTSQLNILPTTLNLLGIPYNQNNYIGIDALSDNYEGIVFFNDYSWYDGNVYVTDGKVINNKKITSNDLKRKNLYINNVIQKNDLTLKFNYFKKNSEE